MITETQIITLNSAMSNDELDELLAPMAEIIRSGGLVAFPTETVYGLGADATNADAAKKIYAAKGRPSDNPLIIHVSDPKDAEAYTYTTDVFYTLACAFMPGPLTVVMKAKDTVPLTTRGGLETVAVRCPSNVIANRLIALSGVPIAAPSANRSGSPSPTTAAHVIDDMMGRADAIIDGGDCDFGLESTIVKLDDDGAVTLLRPGKITVEDIEALGLEVRIAGAVTDKLREGEIALSPGMKYRHYAPRADVILLEGNTDKCIEYIKGYNASSVAVICYTDDMDAFMLGVPDARLYDFGRKEDELYQAHSLFNILREADKENFDVIFAPLPRAEGVGLALYNRMIRAAAHKIIKL